MQDKTKKRHIAKTVTWRLVGTIDTIILSWIISGNPFTGLKIGLAEVATKMVLYYVHERLWFKANVSDSKKRHIYKTITWRVLGTMDTMMLAWIISGDPFTGLKIGLAEVITKMGLYYLHERIWYKINFGLDKRKNNLRQMEKNIFPYQFKITQEDRNKLNKHKSLLIWFTGLSGSGKSTIADALEQKLHYLGIKTMALDGDNIRGNLCKGLSFSKEDRSENVRRVAETARLLLESGVVVLASFVSPYKKDREYVEKIIKPNIFVEVFVNTSIHICEKRDRKGLYAMAKNGTLDNLTGVSSPYEKPKTPAVEITEKESVQEAVEKVYKEIKDKLELNYKNE